MKHRSNHSFELVKNNAFRVAATGLMSIVCVAILAGCGGGEESAATPPPTSGTAANQNAVASNTPAEQGVAAQTPTTQATTPESSSQPEESSTGRGPRRPGNAPPGRTLPMTTNPGPRPSIGNPTNPGTPSAPSVTQNSPATTTPSALPMTDTTPESTPTDPMPMPETTTPSVAANDVPPAADPTQTVAETPLAEGERPNQPFGGAGFDRSGVDEFWSESISEAEAERMADEGNKDFLENLGFDVRNDWFVAVDPPQYEFVIPADARMGIKVPGAQTATDDFWGSRQRWVLYPSMPSQFVAVGLNENAQQYREVWNIATKRKLGRIEGIELDAEAPISLSPDGKYFAGFSDSDDVIGIWDIDKEEVLGTIPIGSTWGCEYLAFAAGNRLVFEDEDQLQIWSVPDLVLENYMPIEGWRHDAASSITPGGRYLAVSVDAAWEGIISFYDLTSGEDAGDIYLEHKGECQGTAFSEDGKYFAVMQDGFWGKGVSIFDVQTGEIIVEKQYAEEERLTDISETISSHDRYHGPPLQWFPDGRYLLLYGRGVFDIRAAEIIATLPAAVFYHVRPLPGQRVAVIHEQDLELVPFELGDQFEASGAALAAGGTFADAARPPLTTASRGGVNVVSLPELAIRWSAAPQSTTSLPTLDDNPIEVSGGHVYRAVTSSGDDAKVAIMYSAEPIETQWSVFDETPESIPVRIESYNLKTGNAGREFELPFTTLLMAISPDGTRIATKSADGFDRIDVWSLDDGSHVLGFRPYQEMANQDGAAVDWCGFVGTDRLLTAGSQKVTLWRLPACEAVYELPIGPMEPVLSPAGDYVAVCNADLGALYLVNTGNGEANGIVAFSPEDPGEIAAVAFDPTGRKLAAVTRRMSGGEIVVVDLQTGEDVHRFPSPVTGSVVQWAGDGHLLVDGASLISLSSETVCWGYQLPFGRHLVESPDGNHWYMSANNLGSAEYILKSVHMPHEEAVPTIDAAALQRIMLLEPGGQIAMQLNIQEPPGSATFRQEVWDHLVAEFATANIQVVNQASIALIVSGGVQATGETLTTDTMFNFNDTPSFEIAEQAVVWNIRVESAGQVVWETSLYASNNGGFQYAEDANAAQIQQAAQQQLSDGMWNGAKYNLLNFSPPKHAFPAGASFGVGSSNLTIRGIE